MIINTENYSLQFPKRARKIQTKIIPHSDTDRKELSTILERAEIEYSLDDSCIGVHGRKDSMLAKLQLYLRDAPSGAFNDHGLADRLRNDMKLIVQLG